MITLPKKFPVWGTAMDAMDFVWQHRRLAWRFGGIPLGVGIIASWALIGFKVPQSEPSLELFTIAALQVLVFLAPTVTWYRLVAYGEEEAARRPVFTLGRLEIRVLLWQILLFLLLIAITAPLFFVGAWLVTPVANALKSLGGEALVASALTRGDAFVIAVFAPAALGAAVLMLVVGARLSMVVALASLDTPAGFKRAWRLTRGVAWRLTGALIVIILAIVLFIALAELLAWLLGMILAIAADTGAAETLPFVRVVAQAAINLAGLFAMATLFGFVYTLRADMTEPAADPPPSILLP